MNGRTGLIRRSAAAVVTMVAFAFMAGPAQAATVYWDTNGVTAGAGGATPAGTWDAVSTNWGTANGDGATAAWVANNRAHFAAGTDAHRLVSGHRPHASGDIPDSL